MLPAPAEPDQLWALTVAIIYFGSVITAGILLRMAFGWLMRHYGADLGDVHAQAGPNRRSRKVFLLGSWRTED
jgi:hypothetical protein